MRHLPASFRQIRHWNRNKSAKYVLNKPYNHGTVRQHPPSTGYRNVSVFELFWGIVHIVIFLRLFSSPSQVPSLCLVKPTHQPHGFIFIQAVIAGFMAMFSCLLLAFELRLSQYEVNSAMTLDSRTLTLAYLLLRQDTLRNDFGFLFSYAGRFAA